MQTRCIHIRAIWSLACLADGEFARMVWCIEANVQPNQEPLCFNADVQYPYFSNALLPLEANTRSRPGFNGDHSEFKNTQQKGENSK